MKSWILSLLILVVIAQFGVVASMIAKHERVLQQGAVYRFKTRPIDPADPFQGRYVRLAFESDTIASTNESMHAPQPREQVYVSLSTNEAGFCELTQWSRTQPQDQDTAYLKLKYLHPQRSWNSETKESIFQGLRFKLPFDRFYMEESKALRAERMIRPSGPSTNCWARVRVLNGVGIIEDVYASGQSLRLTP